MKMKQMKKILMVVLAVMLAVVFAGCGIAKKDPAGGAGGTGNDPQPPQTETKGSVEGTYMAIYDISEMVAAGIGEDIEVDLSGSTLLMHINLMLNEDKSYLMEMDVDKFIADTEAYYREIFPSMLLSSLEAKDVSELETLLGGKEAYESYLEEMIDTAMETVEEQYEDGDANLISQGTYSVSGDTLDFSEDKGDGSVTGDGIIQSDGSISVQMDIEGDTTSLVFEKQ